MHELDSRVEHTESEEDVARTFMFQNLSESLLMSERFRASRVAEQRSAPFRRFSSIQNSMSSYSSIFIIIYI